MLYNGIDIFENYSTKNFTKLNQRKGYPGKYSCNKIICKYDLKTINLYYAGSSHLPNERCERSHNVHRSLTVM